MLLEILKLEFNRGGGWGDDRTKYGSLLARTICRFGEGHFWHRYTVPASATPGLFFLWLCTCGGFVSAHAGCSYAAFQVDKVEEPTDEQVSVVLDQYIAGIEKLFKDNAEKYGSPNNLVIL